MVDLFDKYDQGLQFEHELINRRLTWLLTSQTILFAALAFAQGKDIPEDAQASLFFDVVTRLGFWISILILIGVVMGVIAKCMVWRDEQERRTEIKIIKQKAANGEAEMNPSEPELENLHWG